MTAAVVAVILLGYMDMILGGLPFPQLDRTGVALLGAITLVYHGSRAATYRDAPSLHDRDSQ